MRSLYTLAGRPGSIYFLILSVVRPVAYFAFFVIPLHQHHMFRNLTSRKILELEYARLLQYDQIAKRR